MELSLTKFPWYVQIGAFVLVCGGAVFGFWKFYVVDIQSDIDMRKARLTAMKGDIAKGVATARRLPQFQADVTELERKLENLKAVLPEQKDVADILRRVQTLAVQSNLKIQRFTPQDQTQQALYAELPYKLTVEGTYDALGFFFDKVSKFPRIINIGEVSIKAKNPPEPNVTILAECTATTFVLQEAAPKPAAKGAKTPAAPAKK